MKSVITAGKTIGEVEKITGIPKRRLKYFIERNIMLPSQKAENGYWLYSEADIRKVELIFLYRELGYTDGKTKALISEPDFDWHDELDQQIVRLMNQKKHTENQLFAAEYLRYRDHAADRGRRFEIASFDRDISAFVNASEEHLGATSDIREDMKLAICQSFYISFTKAAENGMPLDRLKLLFKEFPGSDTVQEQIAKLCDLFSIECSLSPDDTLFEFRLVRAFGGMELLLDLILEHNGAIRFLTDALQIYCDGVNTL